MLNPIRENLAAELAGTCAFAKYAHFTEYPMLARTPYVYHKS